MPPSPGGFAYTIVNGEDLLRRTVDTDVTTIMRVTAAHVEDDRATFALRDFIMGAL